MSDYWQRFAGTRASRRAFLRVTGAAAATGVAIPIVGCKGGSTKPTTRAQPSPLATTSADKPEVLNAAGTPRRGGRLITSEAANFGSFDPHLGIALASVYFPRLYNVLVNQSATKQEFMYFDLAASLEMPDAQTFVFRIRPGVQIAPNDLGVPERDLDAEDVRASIERIQTTPAASSYAFAHNYIASVTPSDDTVTVRTAHPYAWFLNRIGLFFNTIVPRELLAGDLSRLARGAAGAGPYRLVRLTEGEGAKFDRNPNYYRRDDATGIQLPYVDGADVRVILDRSAARTAFVGGQLHRYTPAGASEAKDLSGQFVIQREPNFSFVAFTMNSRRPPFDDPRVRLAFSRAINRQTYIDIVYGGEAKADGLVHWPVGEYALDAADLRKMQPHDVADAKRLVEAAGGVKVKLMYPADTLLEEHKLHLPIFIEQMRQAGIEIEHDPQDLSTWIENYKDLNYQCSLALNQLYETPEIPLGFHTTAGPLGDGSYVRGLGDAEIERAVETANQTLDTRERVGAVRDAQRVIYGKTPGFLPLVTPFTYQAYQRVVRDIPAGVGTTAFLLNGFWLDE